MNSRPSAILILIFVLLQFSVKAQKYCMLTISDSNKNAIPKATIAVFASGKLKNYIADSSGKAKILTQNVSNYITVSAVGFLTKENIFVGAADTQINIVLQRNTVGLNEVVITGFTKEVKVEKSIYKVNTISNATLQQQGAFQLSEALQQQGNIYIQQDALLGSTLNLQGIGGQNVKILINGAPINGRENGNVDLRQINVANAERIEIIKGPMSTLYGTDALGGVINIITKTPPNRRRIFLQQAVESIGRFNTTTQLGFSKKRHGLAIGATRDIFLGYGAMDSYKRANLWKPNELINTDLAYTYTMRKAKLKYMPSYSRQLVINKGVPSVDPFSASALDENYFTTRFINLLQADIEIDSNRKLVFTASHNYYQRIREVLYKDLTTMKETRTTNSGDQDTSVFKDINFRGTFSTDWDDKVNLLTGIEINNQQGRSNKLLDKEKSFTDISVFATLPIMVFKNFQAQPALRLTYNTAYNVPALPSLHLKYQFPNQTIFRASYARGFRAPSLKERYLYFVDQNHNVQGTDSLLPESSHHIQMNWNAKWTRFKKLPMRVSSSTYYNTIYNQIVLALVNANRNDYRYANIENFKNLCQEFTWQINYAKLNTTVGTSFNYLFLADSGRGYMNKELNLQTNYSFGKYNTAINLMYRYIHKQALLSVTDLNNEASYSSFLPPTNFMDANLTQNFLKNSLNVQLGIRNIFNIGTLPISGAPLQGNHGSNNSQLVGMARNYFIKVGYNF